MRRLLCILLMMCLPLQGFAMQWSGLLTGESTTIAHELAHEENIQHHHEDDGTVHYDDSGESADHMLDHQASAQPLHIVAPSVPAAPEQLVSSLPARAALPIPDPFLDCPHRPPAIALG